MRIIKLTINLVILICLVSGISCHTGKEEGLPDKSSAKVKTNSKKGYTGVYKSYRNGNLYSEVTLKNGKKDGPAKKYYPGGQVHTTVTYENDVKTGISRWYYTNGLVYRETPYKNGMINGIQKKYHKDGSVQALIPYINGKRKLGLRETGGNGSPIKSYPVIEITMKDRRSELERLDISIKLSNGSSKVKFYQGRLTDSIFDPDHLEYILTENGKGTVTFIEKEGYTGSDQLHIIAWYRTRLGNRKILQKRVVLPSKNLKQ